MTTRVIFDPPCEHKKYRCGRFSGRTITVGNYADEFAYCPRCGEKLHNPDTVTITISRDDTEWLDHQIALMAMFQSPWDPRRSRIVSALTAALKETE